MPLSGQVKPVDSVQVYDMDGVSSSAAGKIAASVYYPNIMSCRNVIVLYQMDLHLNMVRNMMPERTKNRRWLEGALKYIHGHQFSYL